MLLTRMNVESQNDRHHLQHLPSKSCALVMYIVVVVVVCSGGWGQSSNGCGSGGLGQQWKCWCTYEE